MVTAVVVRTSIIDPSSSSKGRNRPISLDIFAELGNSLASAMKGTLACNCSATALVTAWELSYQYAGRLSHNATMRCVAGHGGMAAVVPLGELKVCITLSLVENKGVLPAILGLLDAAAFVNQTAELDARSFKTFASIQPRSVRPDSSL